MTRVVLGLVESALYPADDLIARVTHVRPKLPRNVVVVGHPSTFIFGGDAGAAGTGGNGFCSRLSSLVFAWSPAVLHPLVFARPTWVGLFPSVRHLALLLGVGLCPFPLSVPMTLLAEAILSIALGATTFGTGSHYPNVHPRTQS